MERRGMHNLQNLQNLQNSNISYTNTNTNNQMGFSGQDPVVKLPLAPIISTPSDRRGANAVTATVSTRRGSSIFSPSTQTLDHLNIAPPAPPPPPKESSPDPDPDPVHLQVQLPENQTQTPNQTSSSTTPQPQSASVVRYRECLKNHAASMGGHVVDGCGEFMPNGDDGTPEALRCAACDCHRNFHRKEVEDHNGASHHLAAAATATVPYQFTNNSREKRSGSYPHMVNFGGGGGAESSSEDLNMYGQQAGGSKKRFRTKFSQEQKDKMSDFAERLGWRMQKQTEGEVQQFCSEVGVKRQVFKVWMHNNKQAIKKKQT